jgi:hypothetical protein
MNFFSFLFIIRFLLGNNVKNILNLIKLFGIILIVNHIFACIWIKIHYLQINRNGLDSVTWLNNLDL